MVFCTAGFSAANLQNRHRGLFFPCYKVQPRAGALVFCFFAAGWGGGAAAGQDMGLCVPVGQSRLCILQSRLGHGFETLGSLQLSGNNSHFRQIGNYFNFFQLKFNFLIGNY